MTFAAACLLDEKKKAQYDRELDAWFNEFDSGSGDDYELEEPDLPMAKIVQREKTGTKSKSGSGKSKSGSSVRTSGSKSSHSKTKSSKSETKSASKKPANVGLIVGLAAAVVAILGLGGGLAYVFLKADPPAVAKVDDKPKTPVFDPDEEDDTPTKKVADPDDEEASEDKKTDAAADPDEDEKMPEAAAEVKDPAGAAAETTPADPMKTDPASTATPAAETTAEKPADPPMTAAVTPMPMPAATDPAKTPGPEKAPPAQPETPADPKLEDPFREVDTALEIPDFVDQTSTTPVVIAKIYPKEGERVNAKLLAGDVVLAKLGDFSLSGGSLTDPEPKWTIKFVDRQGKSAPIADLSYKTNELTFAWTGQGDADKNNVLKNCLLQVTAGYSNKRLPLRKPIEIEPLIVDMDPKGATLPIDVVGLPEDRETVIMEITKLVGGFPADSTYDPGQQIKPGESVSVMFGKLDIAFKGTFSEERGKGLKLDWKPMIRGPKTRNNGPRPLKPFKITPPIDQQIAYAQNLLTQGTANYEGFKKANAAKKEVLEQAELNFTQATNNLNEQIKQLGVLRDTIDAISKDGKVQFRIFMRVGDYSIEIVKTKDYSPPEEEKKEDPKKAPAAKKKK